MSKPDSGARTIFLVGFMGAGKSSVGLALSRRLGWAFEDLDHRIEAQERRSIEKIFRAIRRGWLSSDRTCCIAFADRRVERASEGCCNGWRSFRTGGQRGASRGEVGFPAIFLDAPVEELFRRCLDQQLSVPYAAIWKSSGGFMTRVGACYLSASVRIETGGKDVEQVAAEAIESLGLKSD